MNVPNILKKRNLALFNKVGNKLNKNTGLRHFIATYMKNPS